MYWNGIVSAEYRLGSRKKKARKERRKRQLSRASPDRQYGPVSHSHAKSPRTSKVSLDSAGAGITCGMDLIVSPIVGSSDSRIEPEPSDFGIQLGSVAFEYCKEIVGADPSGAFKSLSSAERLVKCSHSLRAPQYQPQTNTGMGESYVPITYFRCTPEDTLPWLREWQRRAYGEEITQQGLYGLLECARMVASRIHPGAVAVVSAEGNDIMRFFTLSKPVGAHVAALKRVSRSSNNTDITGVQNWTISRKLRSTQVASVPNTSVEVH
ncbi:hypothetical protein GGR53DRAFT_471899 [Hypoxylon sp. FL1150]|nr:hypothetical protein GGR53DRAFT_471899 [Hypoxylon sp. FL1150]